MHRLIAVTGRTGWSRVRFVWLLFAAGLLAPALPVRADGTNLPPRKNPPVVSVLIRRPKNVTTKYVTDTGRRLTAYYDNQHDRVVLTLPNLKRVTLYRDSLASGVRYTKGNQTFWEHQGEVVYSVGTRIVYTGTPVRPPKRHS